MKKTIIVLLFLMLLCSACSPTESAVQTAIALTQAALPTTTHSLTSFFTSTPTLTSTPSFTPTPDTTETTTPMTTMSTQEIATAWPPVEAIITNLVSSSPNVQNVQRVILLPGGIIQIDYMNIRMIKEQQQKTQFSIIQMLSTFCSGVMAQQIRAYTGIENPILVITSESADNLYIYRTTTDFQTCSKIGLNSITFDEWLKINQGEFSYRETNTPTATVEPSQAAGSITP